MIIKHQGMADAINSLLLDMLAAVLEQTFRGNMTASNCI
jgi:hypothetical protein